MVANLIGVSSTVPENELKGRVVFFSMPDDTVSGDDLVAAAAKHGVDDKYLPDLRQPVHVFQSACASVAERRGSRGDRVEVRADEVQNDTALCSYQITRVVWDLDNHVIEHEKALRLEFDKKTQQVRSVKLDRYDPALHDLESRVRDHYDANQSTIPGSKIRNMVRDTLIRIGGINMRRRAGGVYFVPRDIPGTVTAVGAQQSKVLLEALNGMLEDLYADRGDLYGMPVMDGAAEMNMIMRHASLSVVERAKNVSASAFARLRSTSDRKVRSDFAAGLVNDRRTILQLKKHYEELIGSELADVNDSIRELDEAIEKIEAAAI